LNQSMVEHDYATPHGVNVHNLY